MASDLLFYYKRYREASMLNILKGLAVVAVIGVVAFCLFWAAIGLFFILIWLRMVML